MDNEFDFKNWDIVKDKLKNIFPQLTDADLIWRHGTGDDLYTTIATKLGKTKKEFHSIVDSFNAQRDHRWQDA
jgi:hypothetical protein